ncbi:MAG: hypothetical protein ACLFQK_05735 [Fibrobacterota bacterium]
MHRLLSNKIDKEAILLVFFIYMKNTWKIFFFSILSAISFFSELLLSGCSSPEEKLPKQPFHIEGNISLGGDSNLIAYPGDTALRKLHNSMKIKDSCLIITGQNSSLRYSIGGKLELACRQRSVHQVFFRQINDAVMKTSISISAGTVYIASRGMKLPESRLFIETPYADAYGAGSDFMVSVDTAGGITDFLILEGTLDFEPADFDRYAPFSSTQGNHVTFLGKNSRPVITYLSALDADLTILTAGRNNFRKYEKNFSIKPIPAFVNRKPDSFFKSIKNVFNAPYIPPSRKELGRIRDSIKKEYIKEVEALIESADFADTEPPEKTDSLGVYGIASSISRGLSKESMNNLNPNALKYLSEMAARRKDRPDTISSDNP